jgi:hypothetical protein
MATQEVKRKLVAILSVDVKGYSRLMGADEESTLRTLTAYREVMVTLELGGYLSRRLRRPFLKIKKGRHSGLPYERFLTKRKGDLC